MKHLLKRAWRSALMLTDFVPARPRDYALIAGCPRSGTSALIYWIASSPSTVTFYEDRIPILVARVREAVGEYGKLAGRKEFLVRQLRRMVERNIVDQKMPWRKLCVWKEPLQASQLDRLDFQKIYGDFDRVFPETKTIFLVRHPVPVVNSMLKRTWGSSLAGQSPRNLSLDECIAAWKASCSVYENSPFSKVMLLRFEDLVEEPKQESQRVAEFLGLSDLKPFEPRETKRVDMDQATIDLILHETASERQQIGYGDAHAPVLMETVSTT